MSKSPQICIITKESQEKDVHPGIDINNCESKYLSHYNLIEEIEDYIELVKINNIYQLFDMINVVVEPTEQYILNIDDLYYTEDYVFQAIFKTVVKNNDNDTYTELVYDSNKLATQFLGERHIVEGNMIIIKRSIYNTDFNYVDVTPEDLTQILASQFLHKSIILKEDDTIAEAEYIFSPLETNFGQSHLDNVRYHEFKYLDYRLFFHVDIKANRDKLNVFASAIYGQKLYGNVLISLSDNSDSAPVNLDLTQDLIKKIASVILYHKLNNTDIDRKKYSRKLHIENKDIPDYNPDIHTSFDHNNFPEVTLCPNFFQIIKEEYNNIKNKNDLITLDNVLSVINTSVLNDVD